MKAETREELHKFDLTAFRQKSMKKYILQRDMPGIRAGTIFVHDTEDTIRGSIAEGCLKLAWTKEGNCQLDGYVADSFVLHAKVRKDPKWFKPVEEAASLREELHRIIDEHFDRLGDRQ